MTPRRARDPAGWHRRGGLPARILAAGAALSALIPVLGVALGALLLAVAARADPNALWRIVHEDCVPKAEAGGGTGACAAIDLQAGWALLKDNAPSKKQQFLLIPTARVSGIEDPAVLAPGAPDWFGAAWAERGWVARRLGRDLDRSWTILAINAPGARTQAQLHIHIGCVRAEVRAGLAAWAAMPPERWSATDFVDRGHRYRVMRILGRDPGRPTPFQRLAELPAARADRGAYSLAVLGARFGAAPGFFLLAASPAPGPRIGAEALMAPDCEVLPG